MRRGLLSSRASPMSCRAKSRHLFPLCHLERAQPRVMSSRASAIHPLCCHLERAVASREISLFRRSALAVPTWCTTALFPYVISSVRNANPPCHLERVQCIPFVVISSERQRVERSLTFAEVAHKVPPLEWPVRWISHFLRAPHAYINPCRTVPPSHTALQGIQPCASFAKNRPGHFPYMAAVLPAQNL